MSSITPTIGRKVWFYEASDIGNVINTRQAFDATVVYVHDPLHVNLLVADHAGKTFTRTYVELRDPAEGDMHGGTGAEYATWMPYQVKAAAPA